MFAFPVRAAFAMSALLVALTASAQTPAVQAPAAPTPAVQSPVAQKPAESFNVVSTGANHLRVQISEPSTLNKVFKAICTEQKLDCVGAETVASYTAPKMAVDGTLREVVDNLLSGTGVNYRYTYPTASAKAKLVLLGHAPQGINTPPPVVKEEEPPMPLHSIPYPGPRGRPGATVPATNSAPNGSDQPQTPNGPNSQ